MPIDPDNVRIDLLKFRRKAFLSYPENSPERKKFLKTILENELAMAKNDMPHIMGEIVLKEKGQAVQKFIKEFFISLICFAGSTFLTCYFYSFTKFALLGTIPAGFFFQECVNVAVKFWKFRVSVKNVEKYSSDMQRYISRISSEIKRLDGPRGL